MLSIDCSPLWQDKWHLKNAPEHRRAKQIDKANSQTWLSLSLSLKTGLDQQRMPESDGQTSTKRRQGLSLNKGRTARVEACASIFFASYSVPIRESM